MNVQLPYFNFSENKEVRCPRFFGFLPIPLSMNEWCIVIDEGPTQGVFAPNTQHLQDRLQIPHDPDKETALSEDEVFVLFVVRAVVVQSL